MPTDLVDIVAVDNGAPDRGTLKSARQGVGAPFELASHIGPVCDFPQEASAIDQNVAGFALEPKSSSGGGKPRSATAPPCEDRASRAAGWRRHLFVVPAEHGRQSEHAQPDLVEDAVGQDARQRCQQLQIAASAVGEILGLSLVSAW